MREQLPCGTKKQGRGEISGKPTHAETLLSVRCRGIDRRVSFDVAVFSFGRSVIVDGERVACLARRTSDWVRKPVIGSICHLKNQAAVETRLNRLDALGPGLIPQFELPSVLTLPLL